MVGWLGAGGGGVAGVEALPEPPPEPPPPQPAIASSSTAVPAQTRMENPRMIGPPSLSLELTNGQTQEGLTNRQEMWVRIMSSRNDTATRGFTKTPGYQSVLCPE